MTVCLPRAARGRSGSDECRSSLGCDFVRESARRMRLPKKEKERSLVLSFQSRRRRLVEEEDATIEGPKASGC